MDTKKPDKIDKALGERIRSVRLAQGISQESLAKVVGITFQQVQKYERGTNRIGFGRLVVIASALNTKVRDLIDPVVPKWHRA